MGLASSIKDLLEAATPAARPIDVAAGTWLIDGPVVYSWRPSRRKAVDRLKHDLIRAVTNDGRAVIYHSDSPLVEGVPGPWSPTVDGGGWNVPATIDLSDEQVQFWLFTLGNWTLVSDAPARPFNLDPFRAKPSETAAWLTAANVDALLCSWPDDHDWLIAYRVERRAS